MSFCGDDRKGAECEAVDGVFIWLYGKASERVVVRCACGCEFIFRCRLYIILHASVFVVIPYTSESQDIDTYNTRVQLISRYNWFRKLSFLNSLSRSATRCVYSEVASYTREEKRTPTHIIVIVPSREFGITRRASNVSVIPLRPALQLAL